MTLSYRPDRAELRRFLQAVPVHIGPRSRWPRSVLCHCDAEGRLRASEECSLRTKWGWVLRESPAPLGRGPRQRLRHLCREIVAALPTPGASPGYSFSFTLGTDEELHLEAVEGLAATPAVLPGYRARLRIHALAAARLQDLRGVESLQALLPQAQVFCQAGDWCEAGKVLAACDWRAQSRQAGCELVAQALAELRFDGLASNLPRLQALLGQTNFRRGAIRPSMLDELSAAGAELLIENPGIEATVQDLPGRLGYWEIGVPPSGPMDELGLRLANEAVGNHSGAAGIEITLGNFQVRARAELLIALGGAPCEARLDEQPVPMLAAVRMRPGQRLRLPPPALGLRTYLAVRGGIDCGRYLGSRSTFSLGGFGGWQGRALRRGDALPLGQETAGPPQLIAADRRPQFCRRWRLGVLLGPHTAPDFLTEAGLQEFCRARWKVSPQSNRTGVRLLGPRPDWSRADGGEAGLHPSNLHDNAYAFGACDLTGDTPVILGPDGPSPGGFVCPLVVVAGQRWKLGQLRPGDQVEFVPLDLAAAQHLQRAPQAPPSPAAVPAAPIIQGRAPRAAHPGRCLRRQGDEFLLLEYGDLQLDLGLRLRVQALYARLQELQEPGIIDLTPGIRSLQVHFDPQQRSEASLVALLCRLDDDLASDHGDLVLSSRVVELPLSWDDPSTRKAIRIYMQTVNPEAPWCPWNIEFIRRINGLDSVDEVKNIVFDASYLVYGLGDVYLGAPVATPWDPRHRLVTTKYNPARTWTPENAVGIGGAYLCVYGMQGPGGYQFVGRTVQVWNPYPRADCFVDGRPWLLRQFDQLRFVPVTAEELLRLREDFPAGRWQPKLQDSQISLAAYQDLCRREAAGIERVRVRQQAAFAAERQRWQDSAAAKLR